MLGHLPANPNTGSGFAEVHMFSHFHYTYKRCMTPDACPDAILPFTGCDVMNSYCIRSGCSSFGVLSRFSPAPGQGAGELAQ